MCNTAPIYVISIASCVTILDDPIRIAKSNLKQLYENVLMTRIACIDTAITATLGGIK
jgi:hypothetical protein